MKKSLLPCLWLILLLPFIGCKTCSTASASKPTFVIVHGAWGGGWDWKHVADLLTADGYTVYRPTLTGLGEHSNLSSTNIDLDTHIQDIVNVILWENLRDVVLVGHSYGGMVITGVADRVPDRIRHVIYVDALLPENGENVNSIIAKRLLQPVKDGFITDPWVVGNDPRLTSNTYADASLFALREAVERLPWDDAQRDAQKSGASGLLPSLSVTVGGKAKSEKTSVEMGLMSVSVTGWHEVAKTGQWCAIEGLNL